MPFGRVSPVLRRTGTKGRYIGTRSYLLRQIAIFKWHGKAARHFLGLSATYGSKFAFLFSLWLHKENVYLDLVYGDTVLEAP